MEPGYWLGYILVTPMIEVVASDWQRRFELDQQGTLPRYRREREVCFACHGRRRK